MRLRPLLGPSLAVVFTAVGYWCWRTPWGLVLLCLAGALLLLALCTPRWFAPVQAALERTGRMIAAGFTWVVLALLFLLIFVPGRLVFALRPHDPLQRRPDSKRASYWEPLPPAGGPARFRRQF